MPGKNNVLILLFRKCVLLLADSCVEPTLSGVAQLLLSLRSSRRRPPFADGHDACSDLRLHDNPLLQLANAPKATTHVLPIFVFDDRVVDCSSLPGWKGERGEATSRVLGIARCGANRTKCVSFPNLTQLREPSY